MQIVTGYEGQAHITSNDDQGRNQGTFGEDSYVLSVGSKFAPTLLSANSLKIADGEGVHQGVHFRVDPGTYDTVTIENGTQGMNRKDLIVCIYTKDAGTGVEQTEWVVIKGTPSSGTATRPSPTTGDIRTGSTIADMSMFEVVLSGVNVTAVNALFSTIKTMSEMQSDISTINSKTTTTFKTVDYSYQYTLASNAALNISASDFGFSTPSGYTPLCFSAVTSGHNGVCIRAFYGYQTSGTVLVLRSVGYETVSPIATVRVVYVKSGLL